MIDSGAEGNFIDISFANFITSLSFSCESRGSGGSARWTTAGLWEDQIPDSGITTSNRSPTPNPLGCSPLNLLRILHPGLVVAGETQSPHLMVNTAISPMVRVLSTSLSDFKLQINCAPRGGEARAQRSPRITHRIPGPV